MPTLMWRRRILPLTMAGMVFVLTQRAADLAHSAMARDIGKPAPGATGTPAASGAAPAAMPAAPAVVPVAAAAAAASDPASPSAEARLLAELKRKREELDRREAKLRSDSEVLEAAELRLHSRLDELAALQGRLEGLRKQQQDEDRERWQDLVKVYAAMKPRDAAAIFDLLDSQTMTEVLDHMDDRKASGILAAMTPDRARVATQLLVRKRGAGQEQAAVPPRPDPG